MKWGRATLAALAGLWGGSADAADIRLMARETRAMSQPGATAAFAVDPTVVEASVLDGRLVLVGRHAGETLVSLVHPGRVDTLSVIVVSSPSKLPHVAAQRGVNSGQVAVNYDSGLDRKGVDLSVHLAGPEREARVRVHAIHGSLGSASQGLALPNASVELRAGDRKVTLLDEYVEGSPLTLDGTVLRGVHASNGKAEVHVGVASTQPWEDVLLPSQGDRAASIGWVVPRGSLSLFPSLLWLPDAKTKVPGVASLGLRRGAPGDALQVGAELGLSDTLGVAFDLSWRQSRRQLWLRGAHRPDGFAALDLARPAGSFLEGAWSERLGTATQATATMSANRLELESRDPRAVTAQVDVRSQLGARWSATVGVGGSHYRELGGIASSRRTASVGAAYDTDAVGLHAQYRRQQASGFDAAGHGGRIGIRAQRDGFRVHAYMDAQKNAPGLLLHVPPDSNISRALAELGMTVGSPEEIIGLVRDHAALFARHGVSVGNLRLDPLRLQAGMDLAWQPGASQRNRLGLRVQANETRGLADRRRTTLATVFAGWRVFEDLDLEVGLTRWSSRADDTPHADQNSLQLVLRKFFNDFTLPVAGRRSIRGWVLQDTNAAGNPVHGAAPVPHVEVVLDGHRRARTDAEGRFEFDAPGPGAHQVVATLPAGMAGYFTGPSSHTLRAGDEVRFAVLPAPARLAGRVLSDAGFPLAGVSVRLTGSAQGIAVTDSNGAFRFATAPGDIEVSLAAESIPEGYELSQLAPQREQVRVDTPAVMDFVLRAQRSIRGRLQGTTAGAIVSIPALGKSVVPDSAGRFILRGLPAGPVRLVVKRGAAQSSHIVSMPDQPGAVDGVVVRSP